MHDGTRHAGKAPRAEQADAELASLRTALEKAISAQDFEEAAALRDRIHDMEDAHPSSPVTP